MAQYDLGKVSIRPRGAYAANTNYEFLDSVQNLGGSWLALAASKDVQPGVTAGWQNYWMMITRGIKTIVGSSPADGQTKITITFTDGATATYTYNNEVLANGSVTRAKLANDALISPVKWVSASPYTVIADDLEKTIVFDAALAAVQINMSNELIAALPTGASFAFMQWSSADSTKLTITAGSDYYIGKAGEKSGTKGGSVATSKPRVMVVAKKMTTSSVMIFGVTD